MTKQLKEIAPSLLSADFTNLGEAIQVVERGGAGIIHVDVMDGHFVPNLTIGPPVIEALRRVTQLKLDVHLMIQNPDQVIDTYLDAGADMLSVHVEASRHLHRTLTAIKERGAEAGIVLNPATSLAIIEEALPFADFVLLMSVNPGFGGQQFIHSVLNKIRCLKKMIDDRGYSTLIEVDGGVTLDNISALSEAGVNIAVAGSTVFGSRDPEQTIQQLLKNML